MFLLNKLFSASMCCHFLILYKLSKIPDVLVKTLVTYGICFVPNLLPAILIWCSLVLVLVDWKIVSYFPWLLRFCGPLLSFSSVVPVLVWVVILCLVASCAEAIPSIDYTNFPADFSLFMCLGEGRGLLWMFMPLANCSSLSFFFGP